MDLEAFKRSITEHRLPEPLSIHLKSLWYDGAGEWKRAHDLIDDQSDQVSARIHAYLHRKEGDQWNADYWYRRANATRPPISLTEEWESLVIERLDNP